MSTVLTMRPQGHRQAYLAGVSHRDISENNIMISDALASFFVGFLFDFDYSFDWKEWYRVTMNGWLAVARISCSANARLIFRRSIISFLDRTRSHK